mmetsp:Transcript_9890/g.23075  ORF Transcript_9890/g.23075 Transcript_9890/m.23075 type:complete len:1599 (+) Transcript_9890:2063-6859(+)
MVVPLLIKVVLGILPHPLDGHGGLHAEGLVGSHTVGGVCGAVAGQGRDAEPVEVDTVAAGVLHDLEGVGADEERGVVSRDEPAHVGSEVWEEDVALCGVVRGGDLLHRRCRGVEDEAEEEPRAECVSRLEALEHGRAPHDVHHGAIYRRRVGGERLQKVGREAARAALRRAAGLAHARHLVGGRGVDSLVCAGGEQVPVANRDAVTVERAVCGRAVGALYEARGKAPGAVGGGEDGVGGVEQLDGDGGGEAVNVDSLSSTPVQPDDLGEGGCRVSGGRGAHRQLELGGGDLEPRRVPGGHERGPERYRRDLRPVGGGRAQQGIPGVARELRHCELDAEVEASLLCNLEVGKRRHPRVEDHGGPPVLRGGRLEVGACQRGLHTSRVLRRRRVPAAGARLQHGLDAKGVGSHQPLEDVIEMVARGDDDGGGEEGDGVLRLAHDELLGHGRVDGDVVGGDDEARRRAGALGDCVGAPGNRGGEGEVPAGRAADSVPGEGGDSAGVSNDNLVGVEVGPRRVVEVVGGVRPRLVEGEEHLGALAAGRVPAPILVEADLDLKGGVDGVHKVHPERLVALRGSGEGAEGAKEAVVADHDLEGVRDVDLGLHDDARDARLDGSVGRVVVAKPVYARRGAVGRVHHDGVRGGGDAGGPGKGAKVGRCREVDGHALVLRVGHVEGRVGLRGAVLRVGDPRDLVRCGDGDAVDPRGEVVPRHLGDGRKPHPVAVELDEGNLVLHLDRHVGLRVGPGRTRIRRLLVAQGVRGARLVVDAEVGGIQDGVEREKLVNGLNVRHGRVGQCQVGRPLRPLGAAALVVAPPRGGGLQAVAKRHHVASLHDIAIRHEPVLLQTELDARVAGDRRDGPRPRAPLGGQAVDLEARDERDDTHVSVDREVGCRPVAGPNLDDDAGVVLNDAIGGELDPHGVWDVDDHHLVVVEDVTLLRRQLQVGAPARAGVGGAVEQVGGVGGDEARGDPVVVAPREAGEGDGHDTAVGERGRHLVVGGKCQGERRGVAGVLAGREEDRVEDGVHDREGRGDGVGHIVVSVERGGGRCDGRLRHIDGGGDVRRASLPTGRPGGPAGPGLGAIDADGNDGDRVGRDGVDDAGHGEDVASVLIHGGGHGKDNLARHPVVHGGCAPVGSGRVGNVGKGEGLRSVGVPEEHPRDGNMVAGDKRDARGDVDGDDVGRQGGVDRVVEVADVKRHDNLHRVQAVGDALEGLVGDGVALREVEVLRRDEVVPVVEDLLREDRQIDVGLLRHQGVGDVEVKHVDVVPLERLPLGERPDDALPIGPKRRVGERGVPKLRVVVRAVVGPSRHLLPVVGLEGWCRSEADVLQPAERELDDVDRLEVEVECKGDGDGVGVADKGVRLRHIVDGEHRHAAHQRLPSTLDGEHRIVCWLCHVDKGNRVLLVLPPRRLGVPGAKLPGGKGAVPVDLGSHSAGELISSRLQKRKLEHHGSVCLPVAPRVVRLAHGRHGELEHPGALRPPPPRLEVVQGGGAAVLGRDVEVEVVGRLRPCQTGDGERGAVPHVARQREGDNDESLAVADGNGLADVVRCEDDIAVLDRRGRRRRRRRAGRARRRRARRRGRAGRRRRRRRRRVGRA